MNPSFHRFRQLLTASLALGGIACTPSNTVKSGAPVLTELMLIESGNQYVITADTTECPANVVDGADCDASMGDSICRIGGGGADGGAVDGGASSGPMNWCRCPTGSPLPSCPLIPPSPGTWSCGPFAPTTAALAIFDRLLDPNPLDPGDAGTVTGVADLSSIPAPPMPVALGADYGSNGGSDFKVKPVLFPALSGCAVFFGFSTASLRADGPSLLLTPAPQLPVNAEVTIALTDKVRAKDGHTKFVGATHMVDGAAPQPSFLAEGTVSFTTAPFAATVTVPTAMDDAGAPVAVPPDATPVGIAFNAPVDAAAIVSHVTVTGGGLTASDVTITSDGLSVTITPTGTWPASSTIVVTIDATAADSLGDTLGAPVSATFTTAAM
jgi:hypothetical protein